MTMMRRQLERTDLNLTLEVGRRAERAVYEENRGTTLVPLGDRLAARMMNGKRRYATWSERKQELEARVLRDLRAAYPVHTIDCPCDICDLGDRSEAWA